MEMDEKEYILIQIALVHIYIYIFFTKEGYKIDRRTKQKRDTKNKQKRGRK